MDESYKIVEPSRPKTEMQRFAEFFHQDWKLMFPDMRQGAAMYFESLTDERKTVLRSELNSFLDKYRESSLEELKQAWLNCGAQGWQASLNIRDTLATFARQLEQ